MVEGGLEITEAVSSADCCWARRSNHSLDLLTNQSATRALWQGHSQLEQSLHCLLPVHFSEMLLEVVQAWPFLVRLGTPFTEALIGSAASIVHVVNRLHMSVSIIYCCKTLRALLTTLECTFIVASVASRMFPFTELARYILCSLGDH